jgi:hypothetical protein
MFYYLCPLNPVSILCSVIWQSSESLRSSWNRKLKVTSQHPFKLRTEVSNKTFGCWLCLLGGKSTVVVDSVAKMISTYIAILDGA